MNHGIVREEDGWRLPAFTGLGVAQLLIDNSLCLRTGSHEIVVNSWAELIVDERVYALAACPQTNIGKAAELLRRVVTEVSASDEGDLRVDFGGGWRLRVPADEAQMAWTVAVRGLVILGAQPGGGLSMVSRELTLTGRAS